MKYINELTGYMEPSTFFAALTFTALSWFVVKTFFLLGRNRGSQRTPPKFSLKWWWKENRGQLFKHAALLVFITRFAPELIAMANKAGLAPEWLVYAGIKDGSMFTYAVIGALLAWWMHYKMKQKHKKQ